MEMVKYEREIRQWYERYVETFHRNDVEYMENINLKYDHTERVVIESRGIASSLNLNPHDMAIVLLSAMLHDVGRYPQLKEYGTFNDRESVNHAMYGIEILREQEVLVKLDDEDCELILTAIKYHNSLTIPNTLTERERLFVKILRDADKLDIWRILAQHYTHSERIRNNTIDLNLPEGDSVNLEIFRALENQEIVRIQEIKNRTELKLLQIGWVYDISFPWTFQLIENRQFIPQIISTLPHDPAISECTGLALSYVETRAVQAKEAGLRGR